MLTTFWRRREKNFTTMVKPVVKKKIHDGLHDRCENVKFFFTTVTMPDGWEWVQKLPAQVFVVNVFIFGDEVVRLVSRLFAWLVVRLLGRSVVCSVGWSFARLLVCSSLGWSFARLVGRLLSWSVVLRLSFY